MQDYKYVHILGIGGSAMSALASFFLWQKKIVSGYDIAYNESIKILENKGVSFTNLDSAKTIPEHVLCNKKETLIIYTPALGNNNPERSEQFLFFKTNSYTVVKRHDIYRYYTQKHKTIAVAGSHGKTSITSLLGYVLVNSNIPCIVASGGTLNNYNSNFITNCLPSDDYIIILEADEYDNFFANVYYDFAILASISPDHLDYYKTIEILISAFKNFIDNNKKQNALVFLHNAVKEKFVDAIIYGINTKFLDEKNIYIKNESFSFSFRDDNEFYEDLLSPIAGLHQIENTLVAVLISLRLGININEIKKSLESFKGIKRRFNIILQNQKVTFIDDFAHHPHEITQLIKTLDLLYANKKLLIIFQPHSYSRTKNLLNEFANVLSKVDSIIIMDVFPAREDDIYNVSSKDLFNLLTNNTKKLFDQNITKILDSMPHHDVIATVGAGDISMQLSDEIVQWIKKGEFPIKDE